MLALERTWKLCTSQYRHTRCFDHKNDDSPFLVFGVRVPGEEWSWRLLRALRVTHMALAIAFVPRMAFLIRTLLTMTKRAATPASVLLAWSFFMAVLGTQVWLLGV